MDNESNKFVVLEVFNPEYFEVDMPVVEMLVVVRPKSGKTLNINVHCFNERPSFNMRKETISGNQFMVGYILGISETRMDVCIPSRDCEIALVLQAPNRDTLTIDRSEELVLLPKSEYDKLIMKK